MTHALALREKRAALIQEARNINFDTASAEDKEKFDSLMDETDALKADIDRLERAEDAQASLNEKIASNASLAGISVDEATENEEQKKELFNAFLKNGYSGLSAEQRDQIGRFQGNQNVGTDTAGGNLVPDEFRLQLEEAMKAYGGMRNVATVIQTAGGNTLDMPITNATGRKAVIVGEGAAVPEVDESFGIAKLGAYKYAELSKVTIELMQDSAFDLAGYLAKVIGTSFGRGTNEHFTLGTGTNQPSGVLQTSVVGVTAAATDAITYEEIVDLEHSVDPEYRRNAAFMFHDKTLSALKKLEDANGIPLWLPGLARKEPDTILGYAYVINQDMPLPTTGNKAISFGDHSKYMIRDVLALQVKRLVERFIDTGEIGFIGFSRHDGILLDAGTNPVKHLVMG